MSTDNAGIMGVPSPQMTSPRTADTAGDSGTWLGGPYVRQSTHTPAVVYKYHDECGILIYVGLTARGHRRAVEHATTKDWWQFVHSQEVEHYDSSALAAEREAELIQRHRPPFNVVHNPDHAEARAIYIATRPDVVGLDLSPKEAVDQFGREWPFVVCDRRKGQANLVVPPKLWPASRHLSEWKGDLRVVGENHGACGSVTGFDRVGGALWVRARLNKRVRETTGVLAVKFDPNKQAVVLRYARVVSS